MGFLFSSALEKILLQDLNQIVQQVVSGKYFKEFSVELLSSNY
jgi:hypothetical protein